ncbi:DUF2993 domain-containing protein [Streptomyces sp. NPDC090106]|uniref:LmeA family phospholipid-binding protein n=1 Tax=Streptomyces sp. NPDC090106 TaxID=3365946 RepID=UPI0038290BC3
MRALRILLIVVVVLGGLFVIADRVAVYFAEGEVADKLQSREGLASAPDVSIKGFPFLTQVAAGTLDETEIDIKDYEADTGTEGGKIRIDGIDAVFRSVTFSGDYSSATAATASGTATISYAELLDAIKDDPVDLPLGIDGKVTSLAYGGNGKYKATVEAAGLSVPVVGSVTVTDDTVKLHVDAVDKLGGQALDISRVKIGALPGGVKLDKVVAAENGVEITVKGSNVPLAG